MTTIKGLILGSAAGLLAIGGAQAADLPVKAKAVEYVKICSLYGAGFYYIPGTDTCIKIGGAIRLDTAFNGGSYDVPFLQGGAGGNNLYTKNYFTTRERFTLVEDTRTATEYGVLRTYATVHFDFLQGRETIAGGYTEMDYAFIQFAGFTMGKAVSQFDPQWSLARPNISSGYFQGSNNATGIAQLAYTASFGNGVSGTLSIEDGQPYRTAGVFNASTAGTPILAPGANPFLTIGYGGAPNGGTNTFLGNAAGGDHIPEFVGNIKVDQSWGTFNVAAAVHDITSGYYSGTVPSGHPGDKYGYAVTAGLSLTQLFTGPGDRFLIESTYADGAAKYVFGGTVDTTGGGRFSRVNNNQSLGFGYILDGLFGPGGSVQTSKAWQVDAAFEHYWTPQWRTSVFGSYSQISYGSAGDAMLFCAFGSVASSAANPACTGIAGGKLGIQAASTAAISPVTAGTLAATGSFKMSVSQIGTKTSWTPVKDLTFSGEFLYSRLGQNLSGTYTTATGSPSGFPGGTVFNLGSQNTYNGAINATRSF